jgi:hypothetical protein
VFEESLTSFPPSLIVNEKVLSKVFLDRSRMSEVVMSDVRDKLDYCLKVFESRDRVINV